MEINPILVNDLPKLGLDLIGGTTHAFNVHVFLRTRVPNAPLGASVGSMKLMKSKTPRGLCLLHKGETPLHPPGTFQKGVHTGN